MPTPTAEWAKLTDDQRLRAFRFEQFTRMGFDLEQAETLANSGVSWHEVVRLVANGCPCELALRIVV